MKKYNKIQIEEILNNPYVLNCSEKSITFTKECKIESVKLWNKGYTSKEIFRKLKFPEYVINSDTSKQSVCRWNNSIKKSGENAFNELSKRGRKLGFKSNNNKKLNLLTDKEKIEYLETEVAYLRELYKEKHGFYP